MFKDMVCCCLNGREFLGHFWKKIIVKRKVVGGEDGGKMYLEFKQMKRQRSEWLNDMIVIKTTSILPAQCSGMQMFHPEAFRFARCVGNTWCLIDEKYSYL
ncbi:hypothetical protein OSB04_025094, partial [Centaurea solstitialis]